MIKKSKYGYNINRMEGMIKMAYVMKKKIKSDVTYVKNIVNEILIDLNGFLDNKQKFNTKLEQ